MAIKIDHSDVSTYYNKGYAKDELGDCNGAIEDYNKAIKLNPNYSEAYYNRGMLKYELGKTNEACSDFKKAKDLRMLPNMLSSVVRKQ